MRWSLSTQSSHPGLEKQTLGSVYPFPNSNGSLVGDLLCLTPKRLTIGISAFVFLLESITLQRKWASGHISRLGP